MDEYRRQIIYRRGQRKRLIEAYRNKIEFLVSGEFEADFLDLEESDRIIHRDPASLVEKTIPELGNDDIPEIISDIVSKADQGYIFIDEDWRYCGAFFLPELSRIDENFRFGNIITDDVVIVSADGSMIFDLDFYEYRGNYLLDYSIIT